MELRGQVPEKWGCVPHSSRLQGEKGDQTLARLGMSVVRNNAVWRRREAIRASPVRNAPCPTATG